MAEEKVTAFWLDKNNNRDATDGKMWWAKAERDDKIRATAPHRSPRRARCPRRGWVWPRCWAPRPPPGPATASQSWRSSSHSWDTSTARGPSGTPAEYRGLKEDVRENFPILTSIRYLQHLEVANTSPYYDSHFEYQKARTFNKENIDVFYPNVTIGEH